MIEFKLPDLGEGVHEGQILAVHVQQLEFRRHTACATPWEWCIFLVFYYAGEPYFVQSDRTLAL